MMNKIKQMERFCLRIETTPFLQIYIHVTPAKLPNGP